jgi:hypothetical protein
MFFENPVQVAFICKAQFVHNLAHTHVVIPEACFHQFYPIAVDVLLFPSISL